MSQYERIEAKDIKPGDLLLFRRGDQQVLRRATEVKWWNGRGGTSEEPTDAVLVYGTGSLGHGSIFPATRPVLRVI